MKILHLVRLASTTMHPVSSRCCPFRVHFQFGLQVINVRTSRIVRVHDPRSRLVLDVLDGILAEMTIGRRYRASSRTMPPIPPRPKRSPPFLLPSLSSSSGHRGIRETTMSDGDDRRRWVADDWTMPAWSSSLSLRLQSLLSSLSSSLSSWELGGRQRATTSTAAAAPRNAEAKVPPLAPPTMLP